MLSHESRESRGNRRDVHRFLMNESLFNTEANCDIPKQLTRYCRAAALGHSQARMLIA